MKTLQQQGTRWAGSLAAATAALLMIIPGPANAANGNKPRTAPEFGDVPCMQVVERDLEPVIHLDYEIAKEDTEVTEDEVEDSRRHQFFAFGRQSYALPWWISDADVEAAAELGLVDPDSLSPDDVLETAPGWADHAWMAITANDARIPITFEAAASGVDWDITSLPDGAYVVAGYVWEPAVNIWSRRHGVFKIVESRDDSPDGIGAPAAYLRRPPTQLLDAGDVTQLSACIDAMAESEVKIQWAAFGYEEDLDWQDIGATTSLLTGAAGTDDLEFDFRAPGCTDGGPVTLRLVVTDPIGRSYVAYLPEVIVVLHDATGAACEAEQSDPDGGDSIDGSRGCAIQTPGAPSPTGLWVAALIGLQLRRRPRRAA